MAHWFSSCPPKTSPFSPNDPRLAGQVHVLHGHQCDVRVLRAGAERRGGPGVSHGSPRRSEGVEGPHFEPTQGQWGWWGSKGGKGRTHRLARLESFQGFVPGCLTWTPFPSQPRPFPWVRPRRRRWASTTSALSSPSTNRTSSRGVGVVVWGRWVLARRLNAANIMEVLGGGFFWAIFYDIYFYKRSK